MIDFNSPMVSFRTMLHAQLDPGTTGIMPVGPFGQPIPVVSDGQVDSWIPGSGPNGLPLRNYKDASDLLDRPEVTAAIQQWKEKPDTTVTVNGWKVRRASQGTLDADYELCSPGYTQTLGVAERSTGVQVCQLNTSLDNQDADGKQLAGEHEILFHRGGPHAEPRFVLEGFHTQMGWLYQDANGKTVQQD